MATTVYSTEHRVRERVVLTPGVVFKARGGPYHVRLEHGKKVRMSLAAKGPFKFIRLAERGSQKWIEATGRGGAFVVLCLTPRRSSIGGGFRPRPYVVTSTKRGSVSPQEGRRQSGRQSGGKGRAESKPRPRRKSG